MTDSLQSLYEITGDIKDANVILVNRGELRRLQNQVAEIGQLGMALRDQRDELLSALRLAVRQNSHDMLMTGEELRQCEAAIAKIDC